MKMSDATPILQVIDVVQSYPVEEGLLWKGKKKIHAVDGVSFEIFKGKTLGLVGESGCGKSTIARLVAGLETPNSGKVLYQGDQRKIQMIFQDPYSSLNPRKTIKEILRYPMVFHNIVSKSEVDKEIDTLLELVELPKESKDKYPFEFSGGQRQRIAIAKALSLRPRLMICDEATSALDVSIQAQILNLLKELQKQYDLSYLFIGHGLEAVNYVSDVVAVMYLGKIVEIGEVTQIATNPIHPYTKALYSSVPIADPRKRNREKIILEGEIPSNMVRIEGCNFHTRCPFVTPQCQVEVPMLQPIQEGSNHWVACPIVREGKHVSISS